MEREFHDMMYWLGVVWEVTIWTVVLYPAWIIGSKLAHLWEGRE